MGVYDSQIAQAKRMIAAKGQSVTWNKAGFTQSGSQPWKSSEAAPNPASYPVKIVFTGQGGGKLESLIRLLQGTSVPTGAPAGLMAAVPFTPEINDSVTRGSDNLVVKTIDIVAPNGEVILYKIAFA